MSAREIATKDIKQELEKNDKCFLTFHKELNPVMRRLVSRQIKDQISLNHFFTPSHTNSQLVARCFFCKGEAILDNYNKYYSKK